MNNKSKVILQPVKFRRYDHVAVLSMPNSEVDEIVREYEGAEWSTGYRFWHLPLTNEIIKSLKNSLSSVAVVDASALKNFKYSDIKQPAKAVRKHRKFILSAAQKETIKAIEKLLDEKGYSESSTKVFCSLIRVFFSIVKDKDINSLTPTEITSSVDEYIQENSLSLNYKKLLSNAITKFYTLKV